jgi:hypothetical protein
MLIILLSTELVLVANISLAIIIWLSVDILLVLRQLWTLHEQIAKAHQLLDLLIMQVDALPKVLRVVIEDIQHVIHLSRLLLIVNV